MRLSRNENFKNFFLLKERFSVTCYLIKDQRHLQNDKVKAYKKAGNTIQNNGKIVFCLLLYSILNAHIGKSRLYKIISIQNIST